MTVDITTVVADLQKALTDAQAVAAAVAPTTTPPVSATLIPATADSAVSRQYNDGPCDWLDTGKLAAVPLKPWTVYTDAANQILAPSQNGVRAAGWRRLNLLGNVNGLYWAVPRIVNGKHGLYSPQVGDDFLLSIMPNLAADPPFAGPRGQCTSSPYTTWHGHRTLFDATATVNPTSASNPMFPTSNPRMPLYMGLRADGAVLGMMRDGSLHKFGVIPGTKGPHDFTFFPPNTALFFVADTFNNRILKVDRTAAKAAQVKPAFEDGSLWTTTTFVSGLGRITSIRCVDDGTMYACDPDNNQVLKIDTAGNVSKLCAAVAPFWIDYRADGKLMILNTASQVFIVDPATGAVGPNLMASGYVQTLRDWTQFFTTISVDRKGTAGPVDEARVIRSHGAGNVDEWRFSADGLTCTYVANEWSSDGHTVVGNVLHTVDVIGHYPWIGEYHPDQGVMLFQGFADAFPVVMAAMQPTDAPEDVYNHGLFMKGISILQAGGSASVPYGSRPSFTCQMTEGCWSLLGVNADYIADLTFPEQAAFVQGGMCGSFPRPDLVGHDLLAILYTINRSSQRFLREGKSLIDALNAFIGPVTATPAPSLRGDWNDPTIYMKAQRTASGLQIAFNGPYGYPNTSNPPDAGLVVRVTLNKGMPTEQVLPNAVSPWAIAGTFASPGSTFCEVVSGSTKTYRNQSAVI